MESGAAGRHRKLQMTLQSLGPIINAVDLGIPAPDPVSDESLWQLYHQERAQNVRETLFLKYLPFARRTAVRTMRRHTIIHVEMADVFQSACIGLIEALDRFDPSRGAEFTTYAFYRIEGAILNELENQSELQQQIAARMRSRTSRIDSLSRKRITATSSQEQIVEELAAVSMGLAIGFMLEDSGMYADPDQPLNTHDSTYESLAWKQAKTILKQLVDLLPENEQKVLSYHYFQGLAFAQIATLLGISRGRISQIHKQAVNSLRIQLTRFETFSVIG